MRVSWYVSSWSDTENSCWLWCCSSTCWWPCASPLCELCLACGSCAGHHQCLLQYSCNALSQCVSSCSFGLNTSPPYPYTLTTNQVPWSLSLLACLVSTKAGKEHRSPWNYGQLWAPMRVVGIEPERTSNAFNCWVISPPQPLLHGLGFSFIKLRWVYEFGL